MAQLKKSAQAPVFSGVDQDGNLIALNDFKGKKLILFFYPKDDTPGCTAQACNLRDNFGELKNRGYEIVGVSADPESKHRKFIEKYNLPFPLVADTDKKICNSFGVWGEKSFMGKTYEGIHRTTFIIDEQGLIEEVITKVDTKNHTDQILSIINNKVK